MKADRIHEIISGIDPALVEEADGAGLEHKKRMPRLARAGLIAAGLCLARVGTAVAANLIAGFHRMESFHHQYDPRSVSQYYNGYTLWCDFNRVPLDTFSPELLELAQQNPGANIELWATGFSLLKPQTGLDLLAPPALDGLRREQFTAWLSSNPDGQPSAIDYQQTYVGVGAKNHTLNLTLMVSLETEASPVKDPRISVLFPETYTVETEEYLTENGLSVLLSTCHVPEDDIWFDYHGSTYYRVIFMLDGAQYSVEAACPADSDRALTVLKEFLECVHF